MSSMKSVSLASALFLGFTLMAGCDSTESEWVSDGWPNDNDEEASASFNDEVAVDQHTAVRLEGINGTVSVTGSPTATSVLISGRRRVFSETKADAQSHLSDLEAQVDDLGDHVLIRTRQPKNPGRRTYVVDYEITVPESIDVDVDNINGVIDLKDVMGNVSAYLVNGAIECRSTRSPEHALNLSITNGDITLEIPKSTSARLKAKVVHGKIETSDLVLSDRVRSSQSLSGTLGGGLALIDLSTVNGDIRVNGF